ncbi:N-formylglutamate amidohydrolase [Aurantimonas sp. VKM B-3413]|uniref:N-formylglutamate amidohydrolase n=1 Tax=Aurantimonas sp. VKM B-3413 TaxID=2779401 RepID=UPI001E51F5AE|nr:N-formylglutamate amidohydrolase [Aurantimonas sp. VKM B-3413]MCB8839465.1 N-formylglutamate amidohydrolase [Aurantimonas sp. VKM B-3413]
MSVIDRLLQDGDPAPFGTENGDGRFPILFASDHAGRAIPKALGRLGLDEVALARHVAYDIGIYGVTTRLAKTLDATYVFQPYSRLVIDCNRRPGNAQSVLAVSDGTTVPGNEGIEPAAVEARRREILEPYHREIERVLADRQARAQPTALFAMHSCTPLFGGETGPRPWHIGVLANRDWRIGDALIEILTKETDLCVGRNQPYSVDEESDYTIPLHAEANGLPYVEIEIRQDLIGDEAGQREWAELCASVFPRALERSGVVAA